MPTDDCESRLTEELCELARAICRRNVADYDIARIIGRPAEKGHIGEFVASAILGIELHRSATHKGSDGRFAEGPLVSRSVNIKYYGKREGFVDLCVAHPPDFYLVLTGPSSNPGTSRGAHRPFVIEFAYLFDATWLHNTLGERGIKLGVATSVAHKYWQDVEIFPRPQNPLLRLDEAQRALLALFAADQVGPPSP